MFHFITFKLPEKKAWQRKLNMVFGGLSEIYHGKLNRLSCIVV
ncbi:hypothetical protein AOR13_3889 [Alteromonas stellipolaris LMG 21856]|nr:hypothetical protein AOR13_3889 [Alteromonas stellipolaris LMG 21856]